MVTKEDSADLLGVSDASEKDAHAEEEFELEDLLEGLDSATGYI